MALSRRCMIHIVRNQHFRYSTVKSGSSFWEILPKQWRQPAFPQPKDDALNVKMAPSISTIRFLNKFNPFKPNQFKASYYDFQDDEESVQVNIDEETKLRGHSISIAQFLLFCDGKVRFSSFPEWISKNENYNMLPQESVMGVSLVEIDMSYSGTDYVIVKSIKDLNTVTSFSAHNCPLFDDYCLDHLSANLPALEKLDLSDCPKVTSKGLGVIYRFKRLRSLNLTNIESDAELELLCVLLEEHFPNLQIEGVSYQEFKSDAN